MDCPILQNYDFISQFLPNHRKREVFSKRLRYILTNPHKFIECQELSLNNCSSIFYFEHIKDKIIQEIGNQIDENFKQVLLNNPSDSLEFKFCLYRILIDYNLKDLIIPFFLWINYFKENSSKHLDTLVENMDFLIDAGLRFETADELINYNNKNVFFRLPYVSENNKSLLMKSCQFMRCICPDLTYTSKYLEKTRNNINTKKRVGFYSERLKYDSSVLRDRMGIISNLDSNKFEVFIFITENEQDFYNNVEGNFIKKFYKNNKDKFIFLPKSIKETREVIEFLMLDILVYCEIGMDYKPYLLSYSRLAKVQINTWGHSETSGIDTIDYFLSSELFELEYQKSKEYYSEKLILLKSIGTYYPKFDFIPIDNFKTRPDLGYSDDEDIYFCLQASFKINTTMEDIIMEILNLNPKAIILLSVGFSPFCKSQLNRMLSKFKQNSTRIRFLGILSLFDYLNIINISDVVLDTYPFGGCNSSLESLYFNKPIVTYPSNRINGRFTYGFYKYIGIDECIVDSTDSYIKLAVKLCQDKDFYKSVKDKISNNKWKLYHDKDSLNDWENFLFLKN